MHNERQIRIIKSDITRLEREINDNITNHKNLVRERTARTLKAPDLPNEEYTTNINKLNSIKEEISKIEREIKRAEQRIIFLKLDLEKLENKEK